MIQVNLRIMVAALIIPLLLITLSVISFASPDPPQPPGQVTQHAPNPQIPNPPKPKVVPQEHHALPPSPPPPITRSFKVDSLRMLWEVFRGVKAVKSLALNLSPSSPLKGDVNYLINICTELYSKALQKYNENNYFMSIMYSRLAIDVIHTVNDIIHNPQVSQGSGNSALPPPPAQLPAP